MALLILPRTCSLSRPILSRTIITEINNAITRCNSTQVINKSNVGKFIVTESPFKNDGSWLNKLRYIAGIGDTNIFALRRASVYQYQACTDQLDPASFFEHLKLPDTLFSFFLIVQLHVWMCQARSMMDGPEGRTMRNEIIERMWQDMDTRLQKIEIYAFSQRKQILNDLLFHHQAAIFSYDEGLLTDDKTLAGAIWRTLYSKADVDAATLELAVRYVRTQMNHLRSIGPREWCLDGRLTWAPFAPINNFRAPYLK